MAMNNATNATMFNLTEEELPMVLMAEGDEPIEAEEEEYDDEEEEEEDDDLADMDEDPDDD